MRYLITLLAAAAIFNICFFLFMRTSYSWMINQARRKGLLPNSNKPTLDDVKKLLRGGEKPLAVRIYSHLYRLDLNQAEREVDLLERNLQHHK